MPIDPSISLQTKVPDGLTNLSTLVNTAGNLVALKKAQATFDPEVQAAQSQARILGANANVAEQTQNPRIAEQQAVTSQQQTAASKAAYDFQNQKHIQAIQTLVGTANDPAVRDGDTNGILAALDRAQQNAIRYGADPKDIEQTFADYREMAKTNPKAVQPALLTALTQGLGGPQQAAVLTPSGPAFNTGQQQIQTNTNPFSAQAPGKVVTGVTNQIPVGTQAFANGTPYITGPNGSGLQTGPKLGEQSNVGGTVDTVNKDFADTQANAANANNAISILQNIKKYSQGAATGAAGAFNAASWASDIARITGLSEGDVKTNTDMLAKNANMLALAGGDTNLARTLAEAANPNTHMNPESIRKAADQVMSIHQMNLAKQQFLSPAKGDYQEYANRLSQFNQVADPRVWQFGNMTAQEKAEMKHSMTPAEQQRFRGILQQAEQMGLVK